jgi:NADH-quinone oxidoreductase subunit J
MFMTIYAIIFYLLGAGIILATLLAVTRRDMVHAVIYLVMSFFGSAMLFYLLGAPFLGALEIIVYAGAIMILFLFIVMMLKVETTGTAVFPRSQWVPGAVLGAGFLLLAGLLAGTDPAGRVPLETAWADPRAFGGHLFTGHWLTIEITSLLLLVALVGALLLGRPRNKKQPLEESGKKT